MKLLPIVFTALCLAGLSADAAVVITTDFKVGPGGATTYTPDWPVSADDLLQTSLMQIESVGGFNAAGGTGGLPQLTDGDFGEIGSSVPGTVSSRPEFAVAGGGTGTGTQLTYFLDTTVAPEGFNLSSIVVYGGWNDGGRDQQYYDLSISLVGAPTEFFKIGEVNFNPPQTSNQSATRVTFKEDTLPWLATGVAAVRFDFLKTPEVENGYTGYAEIDVIGTAVPEPGTALMLLGGLGVCGMFGRYRK